MGLLIYGVLIFGFFYGIAACLIFTTLTAVRLWRFVASRLTARRTEKKHGI